MKSFNSIAILQGRGGGGGGGGGRGRVCVFGEEGGGAFRVLHRLLCGS